jgi:hypothetical protein
VAILLLDIGLSLHKFWVGNSCRIPAGIRVQGKYLAGIGRYIGIGTYVALLLNRFPA